MKPRLPLLLWCGALVAGASLAQTPPPGAPSAPDRQTPAAPGEPAVQRTVVEDEGSRISELRVRGQTQRITVQPKVGGAKTYEIIPVDAGRGTEDSRGAAGKRVWQVLAF